jgi:alkylation response protein AidB-like acyl-CoA dehydrogenase
MNFAYSEEQQMLRDTLQRFIAKDYSFATRAALIKSERGCSASVWQTFAELGLLGIAVPEAHGGMNGNAVDTMLVMEAFGQGLVVEPYLATVVLCGRLLLDAGSESQKDSMLSAMAAGDLLMAFAHYDAGIRYETGAVYTRAYRRDGRYVIEGQKAVVLFGEQADRLIVSARTSGAPGDAEGISLFVVDRTAPGVQVRGYTTQDGQRAAEITFSNVEVNNDALLGGVGRALPSIQRAIDFGIAALCAEAAGAMQAVFQATVEYLKTRKQFGAPIGSFQALKHRAADMFIATEQARSMALLASLRVESNDVLERRRAVSAAKVLVGQAGRYVGQQAVQLHGGMGVTDELSVSHYFKRLTMINATFGDADTHLGQFSDLLLAT